MISKGLFICSYFCHVIYPSMSSEHICDFQRFRRIFVCTSRAFKLWASPKWAPKSGCPGEGAVTAIQAPVLALLARDDFFLQESVSFRSSFYAHVFSDVFLMDFNGHVCVSSDMCRVGRSTVSGHKACGEHTWNACKREKKNSVSRLSNFHHRNRNLLRKS